MINANLNDEILPPPPQLGPCSAYPVHVEMCPNPAAILLPKIVYPCTLSQKWYPPYVASGINKSKKKSMNDPQVGFYTFGLYVMNYIPNR